MLEVHLVDGLRQLARYVSFQAGLLAQASAGRQQASNVPRQKQRSQPVYCSTDQASQTKGFGLELITREGINL